MWLVTRYLNELINSLTWSATVLLQFFFSRQDFEPAIPLDCFQDTNNIITKSERKQGRVVNMFV